MYENLPMSSVGIRVILLFQGGSAFPFKLFQGEPYLTEQAF